MKKFKLGVAVALAFGTVSLQAGEVPARAEDVCPILMGATVPYLDLKTSTGEPFDLLTAVQDKPAVVIVYRGGWCPYCNQHLSDIQTVANDLLALGYQILAISPDRPELLAGVGGKNNVTYTLLSDSSMAACRALGIAFEVDRATVDRYKNQYGIDLEADSGETHHQLPIPSAFIIGRDGTVQFAYVNPEYKARIKGSLLLEAARSLQ